ncbi:MAG: phage terminase large subunit [Nitrospinae bacterium]|nr:phage terminase large subunit [Nitrospinota bacterium]
MGKPGSFGGIAGKKLARGYAGIRAAIAGAVSPFGRCTETQKNRRRERALTDLQFFAETYFPHYLTHPPSLLHRELYRRFQDLVLASERTGDGARDAEAAPRGNAKSTLTTLILPLWCVVGRLRRFIGILSDTAEQAVEFLEFIKAELETNERLNMDFPSACGAGPAWTAGHVVTANGVKIECWGKRQRLRGARHGPVRPDLVICDDLEDDENIGSPEQREKDRNWFFRALMKVGARNTVYIVVGTLLHYDSLLALLLKQPGWTGRKWQAVIKFSGSPLWREWENLFVSSGHAEFRPSPRPSSPPARGQALQGGGFSASAPGKRPEVAGHARTAPDDARSPSAPSPLGSGASPVGDRVSVIAALPPGACPAFTLARGGVAPGGTSADAFFEEHKAEMLAGTEVLWPEVEDYYYLMKLRVGEGPAAFDSEKQNEPVNPDDCLFQEGWFSFVEEDEVALNLANGKYAVYCAVDPSMGKNSRRADPSAIVVGGFHPQGYIDILEADIRKRHPDAIMEDLLNYHELYKFTRVGVEETQFQELFKDNLVKESARRGLFLPVDGIRSSADKTLRITKLQPQIKNGRIRFRRDQRILLDQLKYFPKADHDDGPDALEMLLSLIVGKHSKPRVRTLPG